MTAPAPLHRPDLDHVDFWDLDLFEHGDPHAVWTHLRAVAPVWWHDRPGGEPFWSVTRMEHARAVFGDARRLSSQRAGIMLRSAAALEAGDPAAAHGIQPMIHTDPPRHQPLRKVVSSRFTPRSIAQLEATIRSYARSCMAEAAERREVDFVTDIAHRIPAFVTFWLLDIPEERWDRLAELEHRTVTRDDPEFAHGADPAASAAEASAEIYGYFAELVLARREDLGDDILSDFLRGHIDGEPMPWPQVIAEAGLLLAGGLDTTRAAASAGAMLPLLQHPDQLAALRDDLGLLPTAVEEFVRWASPITSESRTATEDLELGGQLVREGDRVVVWGPSCNRDESVFDEPFRYDIRRTPNRHIGFAYGEHFCLGSHLARLILRVEFEELFARFRDIELAGEPRKVRSNFVGGLKHLPVRLTPR
jgi:cholest-4-en-3-one 26-monooxygenase